jgi:hypothetical protein
LEDRANVKNYGTKKEPLFGIEMTYNDAVHRAFVDHCLPNEQEDAKAADDPLVRAPLFLPGVGLPYHHATITALKVLEGIADPGAVCPTIEQDSGTILCQVNYTYANVVGSIRVVRT